MINYVYQLIAPKVFLTKYEDIQLSNDVIVRPKYMAICHADQRYYLGQRDEKILRKKLPMALVHECCGEVVYDPNGVFEQGESVALIPNVPGEETDCIYENYATDSKFLSSGIDGFLREYINLPSDRLVRHEGVPPKLAAITEFVSVGVHSVRRFGKVSHDKKNTIGIWGDGSLAFVVANILKYKYPESKIIVFGKNTSKLSYFSFVDETYLVESMPAELRIDHAFECCGGEGSYAAIEDAIEYINPQGSIVLMGVSENKVPINTRNILEKGLTIVGSSRSGREDFLEAIEIMRHPKVKKRLELIIYEDESVNTIRDIHRVFRTDIETPFKTVFEWGI